jgi:hypothetical protein
MNRTAARAATRATRASTGRRTQHTMSILQTMREPELFGQWFTGKTWQVWRAFLAALFGLPMPDELAASCREHSGRTEAPTTAAREGWVILGRRGGKSRIAALVAVYLACFRYYRHVLAPGEVGTLAVIAADRRQARVVLRYIRAFLEVPILRQMVKAESKEAIELTNRTVIEVHTASFRAVRGDTLIGVIADEIAFCSVDEAAADPDKEILNGLRPGLATTGGLLLCISSPYARRGELWRNYREHFGKDGDPVLVWQAPTAAMNPSVDGQVIADAYADDESSAAAEYGAEFRRDIEAYISREQVEALVVPGRRQLPACLDASYRAFVDPSGGSADSMTLAIAHREQRQGAHRIILDVALEVKPPFSPDAVCRDFAEMLRAYKIHTVTGDRYGVEWPRERFRRYGIG